MMSSDSRQIPQRDLEQLSAFIDGELSERERAKLEARLEREPRLQAGLQQLRLTVRMVQGLGQEEVPRSFSLTPEMVGEGRRRRAYPWLQFATAFAAFAFLLLVGVDASGILRGAGLGASAPAVQEFAAPEAARLEADLEMEEPEVLAEGEVLMDSVGEERSSAAEVAGQEAPAESVTPGLPVTPELGELAEEAPPEALSAEDEAADPVPDMLPQAEAPGEGEEEPRAEAPAEAEVEAEAEKAEPSEPEIEAAREEPVALGRSFWRAIGRDPLTALLRAVEAALAIMVITLVVLTLRLRPRN